MTAFGIVHGAMRFPEQFRWTNAPSGYATFTGEPYGAFRIPAHHAKGRLLAIIANDGSETGWDHVSVSLPESKHKCPSWHEMCFVKDLFWTPDACVVQFHPPKSDNISIHDGC